jgi:hypothetical protein
MTIELSNPRCKKTHFSLSSPEGEGRGEEAISSSGPLIQLWWGGHPLSLSRTLAKRRPILQFEIQYQPKYLPIRPLILSYTSKVEILCLG